MPGRFINLFLLILLILSGKLISQTISNTIWYENQNGKWARIYLKSSLFPHSSRNSGFEYKGMVFTYEKNYSDSSAIIFVPKGYSPVNGFNDLLIHFHGWGNEVMNVMYEFDIVEQVVASNKNVLLVLAQGPKNAMDSAGGKLEDKNGLNNFVNEILDSLYAERSMSSNNIGGIILSAHSGGYRPAILSLVNGGLEKKVKEIYLFDAFYSLTDLLIPWLKSDTSNKLRSIYTEHLAEEHLDFVKKLAINGLTYNNVLDYNSRILLQFTRVCHDCVIEDNLKLWLDESFLSDIK